MWRSKYNFVLPDNYIEYRKYFQWWTSLRNFDMLTKYINWNITYDQLWIENWWLSRERVRQCIRVAEMKINEFHKRLNKNK